MWVRVLEAGNRDRELERVFSRINALAGGGASWRRRIWTGEEGLTFGRVCGVNGLHGADHQVCINHMREAYNCLKEANRLVRLLSPTVN